MAKPINEHEAAFIRAFVRPEHRDRYLTQAASPKGRKKFLDRLNHWLADDLDQRFIRDLEAFNRRMHDERGLLCHVMADDKQYDGKDVSIEEAFEILASVYFGAIVSFVPGELACYKGESPSDTIWLVRENALHT